MSELYNTENMALNQKPIINSQNHYYTVINDNDGTASGTSSPVEVISVPLPYDLDIFDVVTDERFKNKPRAANFMSKLKKAIQLRANSLDNIHFNKLSLEDSNKPSELMVDWIYNYFRAFFSFDDEQGDMYGLILNNSLKSEFSSEFKPLNETEYDSIAAKTLDFVVENIRR